MNKTNDIETAIKLMRKHNIECIKIGHGEVTVTADGWTFTLPDKYQLEQKDTGDER